MGEDAGFRELVGTELSSTEEGRAVRKGGKRLVIVEAEVVQEDDGEIMALATVTYTRVGG